MSTEVFGVDFSGSKEPGQNIWITNGSVSDGPDFHLEVRSVASAADLFAVTQREAVFKKLRAFIRGAGGAFLGLDFPLSLSESAVAATDWASFIEKFTQTFAGKNIDSYPGEYGENGHTKREVDFRFGGQSPMSPLVRYQVFYGLRDLIGPLVVEDAIRVLPMQEHDPTKPALLEVYPAATFGAERLYRTGYKDTTEESRRRRCVNAKGLQSHPQVSVSDAVVETATQSDDALDSLCAAFAVRRALSEGLDEAHSVEGHIYV